MAYADTISAPIRCGVEVTSVRWNVGRAGFRVDTSDGTIDTSFVVAATGPFQQPVVPAVVPDDAGLRQIHSSAYRNPDELPDGTDHVTIAVSGAVAVTRSTSATSLRGT